MFVNDVVAGTSNFYFEVCAFIRHYFDFFCVPLNVVHAVAQLVEALGYKPEGRVFDSRCCYWNFSLT
jgi:hypothetical protein